MFCDSKSFENHLKVRTLFNPFYSSLQAISWLTSSTKQKSTLLENICIERIFKRMSTNQDIDERMFKRTI